jgi:hypothetical protein
LHGKQRELVVEPLPPSLVLVVDGNVVGKLALLWIPLAVSAAVFCDEFRPESADRVAVTHTRDSPACAPLRHANISRVDEASRQFSDLHWPSWHS